MVSRGYFVVIDTVEHIGDGSLMEDAHVDEDPIDVFGVLKLRILTKNAEYLGEQ